MELIKNYKLQCIIIFTLLFSNFIFGWGFQNLSVSLVPVTYIFLFILLININIKNSLKLLNEINFLSIFIFFLFYNLIHIYFGLINYGFIALRDANYVLDLLFLLVTISFVSKNKIAINKILYFFKILFYVCFIYLLAWMFRDSIVGMSPIITSITGSKTNLFFNFSAIGYLFCFISIYCLYFLKGDNSKKFFFWFFIILSVSIISKRYIYLTVIINFLFIFFIDKKKNYFNPFLILIFINFYVLSYINFFGIFNIELKPLTFYINHMLSSLPNYVSQDEFSRVASSTVTWRADYLKSISLEMISSYKLFFFGKGYGMVLVDFKTPYGIPIREPHNLYLTIFARIGFVGLCFFSVLHFKIIKILFKTYKYFQLKNLNNEKNLIILFIIFFLFVFISAGITSSILSVGCISSQLYILSGLGLSMSIYKEKINYI